MREDQRRRERDRIWDLEARGHTTSALDAVSVLLDSDPADANALVLEARLLSILGRYAEAEEVLSRVEGAFADAAILFREYGHLYKRWCRLDLALASYQKVAMLRPDHVGGHLYMGGTLALMGRLDEAAAAHLRAIECSEGPLADAHHNLGLIRRAQQRYERALRCFEEALRMDPRHQAAKTARDDVSFVLGSRRGSPGSEGTG